MAHHHVHLDLLSMKKFFAINISNVSANIFLMKPWTRIVWTLLWRLTAEEKVGKLYAELEIMLSSTEETARAKEADWLICKLQYRMK